jgi:hypothetical protein
VLSADEFNDSMTLVLPLTYIMNAISIESKPDDDDRQDISLTSNQPVAVECR